VMQTSEGAGGIADHGLRGLRMRHCVHANSLRKVCGAIRMALSLINTQRV
jgi:hypothetical protein